MVVSRHPLLLLLHGNIYTMEADQPSATALALDRSSGRIVAVGDDAEIHALTGPLTESIDLQGRTVLPGFIDAHAHLVMYAEERMGVNLRNAHSEEDAVELVRRRSANDHKDDWILGAGWDKTRWAGKGAPTKASLDAAVPARPVALWDYSYHALWVNSAALRQAGIDAQTLDPDGGRIERDETGEPTGILHDTAASLVERVRTLQQSDLILAELRSISRELHRFGITAVHNLAALKQDDPSLALLQQVHREGALSLRVSLYIRREALKDAVRLGIQAGFGDDHLRFAGIKIFMDGALTPHTALMRAPYAGEPNNLGLLSTPEPEVVKAVAEATGGRLGVAIHAIGDRAVQLALDDIEAALHQSHVRADQLLPAARIRLEHVQLAAPEDIQRMAALGVVGSVQPFHAVADRQKAEESWGERYRRAYAYQTMRQAGVHLALGSDVPVDTCDPRRVIYAAVTRQNDVELDLPPWMPEQALTISQALWAYTVGAAYAGGQEALQGSLAPGKYADLVVLEEDPFKMPTARLDTMQVVATWVGGELVHGMLE